MSVQAISNGNGVLTNGSSGHKYGSEDSLPHSKEKDLAGGANWVVQKFGGTSMGKFALNIAHIIENGLAKDRIAVVLSARSSKTKLDGTTSRLLRAARAAERHDGTKQFTDLVEVIKEDHIRAGRETIKSPEILDAFIDQVTAECKSLHQILQSAHHLEEVSVKVNDKIISKGEKLSCRYMTALLQDHGVAAQYVDLSDVITRHNIPTLTKDGAYRDLAMGLGKDVLACGNRVPVITGFFGYIPEGLLHSIGRGYSDLAAALVAIGLSARELQIWKEVDGIFTADPRKVPTASLLSSVLPSEAAELTFFGSEVIHPFTMTQVIRERIPIRIKNVMNPKGQGTVIIPDPEDVRMVGRPILSRGRSTVDLVGDHLRPPKRPTAVTIKHSIVVMNVHSNRRTRAHGFLASIFSVLDKHHLSVDLVSSSEVHVSLALHSENDMIVAGENEELRIQDHRLQGCYDDLSEMGSVDIVSDMAIISLVGKQLKNMIGISGKFFSCLGDSNVNIEMISQGASEINVSCVIAQKDADRALSQVHTALFTYLE